MTPARISSAKRTASSSANSDSTGPPCSAELDEEALRSVLTDRSSVERSLGRLLQYDLGHATMLMMLAAADLGIGTCHSSVQDQELARKILGFPEDYFLAYLLSLGYPADGPLRPLKRLNRRPFDEVVHRGRW